MVDDDEQTTDRRRTGQGGSEEARSAMEKNFKDTRSLPNEIEKRFEVLHGFQRIMKQSMYL